MAFVPLLERPAVKAAFARTPGQFWIWLFLAADFTFLSATTDGIGYQIADGVAALSYLGMAILLVVRGRKPARTPAKWEEQLGVAIDAGFVVAFVVVAIWNFSIALTIGLGYVSAVVLVGRAVRWRRARPHAAADAS